MSDVLGVSCCLLVIVLPVGMLLGAVILSGGVSLTNACLPDSEDPSDRSLYRARRRLAVPVPGLGQGMGIALVTVVATGFVTVPLLVVLGAMEVDRRDAAVRLIVSAVQVPLVFLAQAGVRSTILPAPFGRACLVVLFEYLIVFIAVLAILAPLVLLSSAARA